MSNPIKLFMGVILFSALAQASGSWTATKSLKEIPDTNNTRTEVVFTSAQDKITYLPSKPPYGMVYNKKNVLDKKEYFVTGWAKGGSTMLFKVFLPSEKKNIPLCEVTSFGESAELRLAKGKVEISVFLSPDAKQTWSTCSP